MVTLLAVPAISGKGEIFSVFVCKVWHWSVCLNVHLVDLSLDFGVNFCVCDRTEFGGWFAGGNVHGNSLLQFARPNCRTHDRKVKHDK